MNIEDANRINEIKSIQTERSLLNESLFEKKQELVKLETEKNHQECRKTANVYAMDYKTETHKKAIITMDLEQDMNYLSLRARINATNIEIDRLKSQINDKSELIKYYIKGGLYET